VVIEWRHEGGGFERLPELAAELVAQKPDVLVGVTTNAAQALKKATSTIPIVMMFPTNPVERGLVTSLRQPGGNVTGTTSALGMEIFGKQLQILKEAIPRASRVALLRNPADQAALYMREVETAARFLNLRLQILDARGPEDFDRAFAAMARERADALLVAGTATFLSHRTRIAELAKKSRLPAMYNAREFVEAGGLMAYAVNQADFAGHAAVYVDKILKGANPADLPIAQPTKFELIVNLKTAGDLGISLPQSLLQRTDEVIQ
jgi:putative ABC transport system substrate-binding protein